MADTKDTNPNLDRSGLSSEEKGNPLVGEDGKTPPAHAPKPASTPPAELPGGAEGEQAPPSGRQT